MHVKNYNAQDMPYLHASSLANGCVSYRHHFCVFCYVVASQKLLMISDLDTAPFLKNVSVFVAPKLRQNDNISFIPGIHFEHREF